MFSRADVTGQRGLSRKDVRRMPSRRRDALDPLQLQLQPGDLVVEHGLGR